MLCQVAFVTEIESHGRFYAVFNSESLYRRLRMLEARRGEWAARRWL
jgi:hypothetical protein